MCDTTFLTSHINEEIRRKIRLINSQLYRSARKIFNMLCVIDRDELNIMLYLILLHHELYLKSILTPESLFEIKEDIRNYGHDIDFLLKFSNRTTSESTLIKSHISNIRGERILQDFKFYPSLRYNFSRNTLKNIADIVVLDMVIIDDTFSGLINRMIDELERTFNYD